MSRRRRPIVAVAIFLGLYVASYLALSRQGFSRDGYFFPPQPTAAWRVGNYACVVAYYPLILVDYCLGTGSLPASEPLWGLSK